MSTRGQAPRLNFLEALLAGLASDGGLYLPESWPRLHREMQEGFAGRPYWQVAGQVITPFLGDTIAADHFRSMLQEAYATFRHKAVAPLVQIDDATFVLELFHGPTLAFKDIAMQLLARLMDHALALKGQRATVIGATSGDTGSAAIEAFRGLSNVDMIILYPHGRVSDVQRRQMTAVQDPNVHAVAIEGTFDDCQALVKALFSEPSLRAEFHLTGVNSINWARLASQIVYYVTAAVALGAPRRAVSFAVPTGNFGDVFAGFAARQMGLPIEQLIVATNANDIVARALRTGLYEACGVVATTSPSMDIQVSSNFERLLYCAYDQDAAAIRRLMAEFDALRKFEIAPKPLAFIQKEFDAASASEEETANAMRDVWRCSGYLLDPHTAVAVAAAVKARRASSTPLVVLGTAHPAKFPDAVKQATGKHPGLPDHLADLLSRPERTTILPHDRTAVERFIRAHAKP